MPRKPDVIDAWVGRRIGQRRTAMGLSQAGLAQRLGVSSQQVQKYEAGANRISASRLHEVALVLGVSPGDLFPPREVLGQAEANGLQTLGFMTATSEGRTVAAAFPLISDRDLRQALARIVQALAPASR